MSENNPRNLISHSEAYFKNLQEYQNNLNEKRLPVVYSLKHLSLLMGLDYKELNKIIKSREKYYRMFYLRKKNGGNRQIQTPTTMLKYIQQSLVENILSRIEPDDACLGFRKGFSTKDNAIVHQGHDMVLRVDLFRFFDSITERRVYGLFKHLGYLPNLSFDLAKLTTTYLTDEYLEEVRESDMPFNFPTWGEARLPQGAPSSPILSNLIGSSMDRRFRNLAAVHGFFYSRYADDLTFSGNGNTIPSLSIIRKIITEEGFFLNNQKVNYAPRGSRQLVTGLTVTEGVHVPKKFKQETKRHLHFCKKYGVKNHLEKIKFDKSSFREWLLGRIYYIYSIEPNEACKLLIDFNEINWYSVYPDLTILKTTEGLQLNDELGDFS